MTDIFLERNFDPAVSREDVLEMAAEAGGCYSIYRVDWNQSFLSGNGRRLICWLTAPDAEAARAALRRVEIGEHLLWSGTVHDSAAADAPHWQEANVLVERSWEEPVTLAEIQDIEDSAAGCLETHQVQFARTFFSADRKRMVCLYRAPDAEAVRHAQRQAGMPLDSVWACQRVREPV